ncbi:MAG: hypothetical protein ABJA86_00710 [Nocardioidaceae bacterium]
MLGLVNPAGQRKRGHDVTTAIAQGPALTAADRCDRCAAQAYVRVTLAGGGELLFCAHHGREHAERLREVAVSIHDETERLDETLVTTPDGEP